MYCPHCGTDAGEAKFCPECGADLGAFRKAKAAGASGGGASAGDARQGAKGGRAAKDAPSGALGPQPRDEASRGPSAGLLWIIIAVVAAVVVGVVLFTQTGDEDGSGGTTQNGGTPATPAPAEPDLSGSYDELVQRANGLYDQGRTLFDQGQIDEGAAYFAAAAKVYAAAWKKQPGDPSVGTDWSVALFYSGDIDGAVKQVEVVLKKEPEFQAAWLNKGIFLTHLARMAEQMEGGGESDKLYDEARQAFVRAVAIDPDSEAGKNADAFLAELPK
jgi:tetratricopeptide (TPR) repeat protein